MPFIKSLQYTSYTQSWFKIVKCPIDKMVYLVPHTIKIHYTLEFFHSFFHKNSLFSIMTSSLLIIVP